MKRDWKEAVIANWKLWIPFQFLNFRFIPQSLQVRTTSQRLPCDWSAFELVAIADRCQWSICAATSTTSIQP